MGGGEWVGGVTAAVAAKWTQLTGPGSSLVGLNGHVSQQVEGQKKMEGVNLRGKMHQTLTNRLCVSDCVREM